MKEFFHFETHLKCAGLVIFILLFCPSTPLTCSTVASSVDNFTESAFPVNK